MKHSKLFLTGMAALLLSFGLMMTGCDSGGDSDDGDPINAAEYIDIAVETAGADSVGGDPAVVAVYKVTVKKPLEADKKATFTNVAGDPTDAPVEYIGETGGTTAAAQATAIAAALNTPSDKLYAATVGQTAGTNDHIITLTANTPGAIAAAPAVTIETYEAPAASDQTTTITATAGDTALVVIATGGTLKTTLYVYLKTTGTPASEITITGTALTGADLTAAGAALGNGVTVTPKTDRVVITGLTAADTSGDADKLVEGTDKVKVTLKADAQQSGASGVAAHTGVPVVVPEEGDAAGYTVGNGTTAATIKYTSGTKELKYKETNSDAVTATLDPDFDAALIAVLGALAADDTITFDAGGVVADIGVVASPTAAKVTAAFGFAPAVTLGDDLTLAADFAVPAEKTLTVAATKKLTVAASKTLTVSGTLAVAGILAWTDDTSVLIIQAGGEVTGTAAAAFHAKAGTITTGASLSLTVTAASDPATATGWTTDNPGIGASVTVTSTSSAQTPGTGTAYVLGNASLAIKNCATGAATTAVVSTAADSAAAGGIKAGTGSAVVITGASG